MKNQRGFVIAFDGPDGVGKSTQLALTADWLESRGYTVYKTRSSGGTPIGEELRKVSLSDHPRSALTDVYITLAMGQALAEELQKHIDAGEVCLIDRSPLTHIAYNTYASQLEDRQKGLEAGKLMFKAWQIDLLFYFEADQSVLDARRKARTDKPVDFFEKQGPAFLERVREGYQAGLQLLNQEPDLVDQVVVVDASETIDKIQAEIESRLQKAL